MTKLSLELSSEANQVLEELAAKAGTTKSDVLRRAIALMEVAVDAKEQKQDLAVVDRSSNKVLTKIKGIAP